MKILLQNIQKKIPLNQKIINEALRKLSAAPTLLAGETSPQNGGEKIRFLKDYCFSVSLVSDAQIKKLNNLYCKKNYPTDVLSFENGDIIISADTTKRNAKVYRNSLEKELLLYVIHGILHLTGYNDTTKNKAKIMEKKQEEILKKIWQ